MLSVYLVDDEPLTLEDLMKNVLWAENGFEVTGSNTNPVAALAEISQCPPDLLVCDLKMPGMNGIELIQQLRSRNISSEIIMLSAYGEFEASRQFFLMSGYDYLLKPLREQEVELVLGKLAKRLAPRTAVESMPAAAGKPAQAFESLIEHVVKHFDKRHTLKSLSDQFNLNPTYICNLFAKHYDTTLTAFLTSLRMQEAARMIVQTETALKEIAVACGYGDYFYFCRVFKQFYSVPPSQYRLSAGNGERNGFE